MKKFAVNDQEFTCENCHKQVSKLNYTSRDHCPFCLYSKHVDINPGDRLNPCKGLLIPIDIEKFKDTFKIIYRCNTCKKLHKNIIATDDDMTLLINLTKK